MQDLAEKPGDRPTGPKQTNGRPHKNVATENPTGGQVNLYLKMGVSHI